MNKYLLTPQSTFAPARRVHHQRPDKLICRPTGLGGGDSATLLQYRWSSRDDLCVSSVAALFCTIIRLPCKLRRTYVNIWSSPVPRRSAKVYYKWSSPVSRRSAKIYYKWSSLVRKVRNATHLIRKYYYHRLQVIIKTSHYVIGAAVPPRHKYTALPSTRYQVVLSFILHMIIICYWCVSVHLNCIS